MGTYSHLIKPLSRGVLPRRYIVLAASPVVSRVGAGAPLFLEQLRVGALTYLHRDGESSWSERTAVYDTTERLLSLIDRYGSRKEVTWIVAHGLAYHVAVSGLLRCFMHGSICVDGYNLMGRSMTARLRIGGKVYHCVDSANYVDADWEWVCHALKMPLPCPYQDTDTDSQALDRARLECATVCELLMRLCDLLHRYAGDSWGWSIGSLAWQSWRRGLIGDKVQVHANTEAHDLERAAYCGQREECRYIGTINGTVNHVDCNSMYGYTMQDTLPCKFEHVQKSISVDTLARNLDGGSLAIAECIVNAKLHDYPCLYYPGKSDPPTEPSALPAYIAPRTQHKRMWGRGKFRTILATPELRRAVAADELVSVARVAWYAPGNPFGRFVSHWSATRDEHRRAARILQEAIAKRILAVIHGKFAQWEHEWLPDADYVPAYPVGHWLHYDCQTGSLTVYRALGTRAQRYHTKGEWRHSMVALSAHVTSAARVHIDNAIDICGQRDVYYIECDGLHVSALGLERLADAGLIDSSKIGAFRAKGAYNGGAWRGIRDYRLGSDREQPQPSTHDRGDSTLTRGGVTGAASPRAADLGPYGDVQLSSLHSAHPVNQLLRPGADGWLSSVSVPSHRRDRYAGRVAGDGWVRPLELPLYRPVAEQQEILRDTDNEQAD